MTINEHYVSGKRQDYRTPLDLARDVRPLLGINLDPCTEPGNHLRATHFYTEKDDGLLLPWVDGTWCNPPFARIRDWLVKVEVEASFGHRIGLYLSAARTETDYLQVAAAKASCIQFLRDKQRHSEGTQAMLASIIYWFNVPASEVHGELGWRGLVTVPH